MRNLLKSEIILFIFTTTTLFLLTEIAIRTLYPKRIIKVGYTNTEKSKYYGWTKAPNTEYVWTNPDSKKEHYYKTNSQGWKDINHSFKNTSNAVRILILGDSFTEGEVPLNLLYTRVLEKKFIDSGIKNIEIISIGVGAWGTDQSLEVLKREGIKYKPDFLFYQFCENDLDNNLLPREDLKYFDKNGIYNKKPFKYEIHEGKLRKINRIVSHDKEITYSEKIKKIFLNIYLIYHTNQIIKNLFNKKIENDSGPQIPWFKSQKLDPTNENFLYSKDYEREHKHEGWKLFEALIIEMQNFQNIMKLNF